MNSFGIPIDIKNSATALADTLFSGISNSIDLNDEKDRMRKLKELEYQSQITAKKYAVTIGVVVVSVGILWYLSK